MARGNQRETDCQRAAARNSKKGRKTKDDGLTPEQRRERDAKALQEKALQELVMPTAIMVIESAPADGNEAFTAAIYIKF